SQLAGAAARLACEMSRPITEVRELVRWARRDLSEGDAQRELLRDVFGNPFRGVAIDPAWLRWQGGLVARLARDVYASRRLDEMPVLGDALEDGGCGDQHILSHCRAASLHARGCWLLDALSLCGRRRGAII